MPKRPDQTSPRSVAAAGLREPSAWAASGLEHGVEIVERSATGGTNQKGYGQPIGSVHDQHRRQRLPRAGIAQLAAGGCRIRQRSARDEGWQPRIV